MIIKVLQVDAKEGREGASQRARSAFTLAELLVVTAIIAILVAILLPNARHAVRQARSTVCKANLYEVNKAIAIYANNNNDWLPLVDEGAARSRSPWSARLFGDNMAGRTSLICPSDPWAQVLRNNLIAAPELTNENSSYGINDFIASSPGTFLANLGRYRPRRPADTILLADMGPDNINSVRTPAGSSPRSHGRLEVDDGYSPASPNTQTHVWLTPRHVKGINVLTIAGNVREINIEPALMRKIESYYPQCAAQFCTLCVSLVMPHYSFAESQAFWWTGPVPTQ